MPKKGYIPSAKAAFELWRANFVSKVTANPTDYGLTAANVVNLAAYSTAWQASLVAAIAAQNAAKGANATNDTDLDVLETEIRRLVKLIQAWENITNGKRQELGITEPDTTRTPLSEQVVLNTPPPVIHVKCTAAKTVRLDFYPTQAPGESEALPEGMIGVEIYVAEGGIPSDESQWNTLALDTNSPYIHNVGNDSTMTLAYKARWVDRRGRKGPFCDPVLVAVTP